MREIKFRAFHEPTKQMFDVFSFDVNNVRAWYPEKYGLEISPDREDCILMQYTGLKDKYGVDIYEYDVLYYEPSETEINNTVVSFYKGGFIGILLRSMYFKPLNESLHEKKIIGNIYENPELLKGTLIDFERDVRP